MSERPFEDRQRWGCLTRGGTLLLPALWASAAGAADLELAGPSRCVIRDELAFRVERALGKPLSAAPPFALRVRAREGAPNTFGADLEVTAAPPSDSGLRTLNATTCSELLDRLALAIALALDSGREDEAPTPANTAAAAPAARFETPPDAPIAVREETGATTPMRLVLHAGLLGDTGTLPRAGAGVSGGAALRWSSIELGALGVWLPPREGLIAPSDPNSPGASIGLLAAALLTCVPLSADIDPLVLGVCAGWEIGRLGGVGTQLDEARHQVALWSAARLALRAEWISAQAPLGLAVTLGAVAPLTRDEFVVRGRGTVHRPAAVVGRASLELFWTRD